MNDQEPTEGLSEDFPGRRPSETSDEASRRAPALVVRLEVGRAPAVVADWDDDHGDEEFTRWIDESPAIARLAYLACELAEAAA